jgi:hypothetical protein
VRLRAVHRVVEVHDRAGIGHQAPYQPVTATADGSLGRKPGIIRACGRRWRRA